MNTPYMVRTSGMRGIPVIGRKKMCEFLDFSLDLEARIWYNKKKTRCSAIGENGNLEGVWGDHRHSKPEHDASQAYHIGLCQKNLGQFTPRNEINKRISM